MTNAKPKARVKVEYTKRGWVVTKAKAKRPRKPIASMFQGVDCHLPDLIPVAQVDAMRFTPKEARRLAAWLTRAADFIERKKR